MGYPLGKAPTQVGTAPWPEEMPLMEGTSPDDMRRIIGSWYENNGIVPDGGLTVEGTSSMAYKVNQGVAFMFDSVSSGLARLVPVDSVTVNTAPAPATGSRIDTIYVDSDGIVRVHEGTNPPHGIEIARFVVPAGVTSTSSAQETLDRYYAIPTGSSLGRLAWYQHPAATTGSPGETTLYRTVIPLPTDRLLKVDITATIKSATSEPGVVNFTADFPDGSSRTLMAHHTPSWNTFSASWSFTATSGLLNFEFRTSVYEGGLWQFAYSSDVVTEVTVWDSGVSR